MIDLFKLDEAVDAINYKLKYIISLILLICFKLLIMEKDSNLFANIEERKEPLLVPPLNLDDLNDNEPLRGDGEVVTFRGDSVHAAERVPSLDHAIV